MQKYPDLSNVKKALVVKLRHHGDVLLSSPVFSVLKQHIPGVEIDAYIYKETLPMLEGHPAISEFLLCDKAWKRLPLLFRLKKERALLKEIKRRGYDLVINLTEGDRGAIACKASKAPIRIGFDPEGSGMWQKSRCYSHIARNCHHPRHTVEKNLDVLRCLGIFPQPQEKEVILHVPEEVDSKIKVLLELDDITPGEYVAIHPVSRWLFKCWPAKKFAELIQLLHREGKKIVLTSSPDPEEMRIIEQILQDIPDIPVCNLAGKISLKELASVIKQSALLVTVDSVSLHISSAFNTPVVAIFGPTSEINWAPWQNSRSRIVTNSISCRPCYMPGCGGSGKSDCLENLPVSKVFQATKELQPEILAEV